MDDRTSGRNNIAIWGTGNYGDTAYFYYRNKCNITCFIDSDERKWGTLFHGIEIRPPDIISKLDSTVDIIVAVFHNNEIKMHLKEKPHGNNVILFQISNTPCVLKESKKIIDEDTIIISFCGGLGNQMFQYALFRRLQCNKKKVVADLDFYCNPASKTDFLLPDIFPNIHIESYSTQERYELIKRNAKIHGAKKFLIYGEPDISEEGIKKAETFLLDITGGYIWGYHQSRSFAESIDNVLRRDFIFKPSQDAGLNRLCKILQGRNTVAVHIRRGDYLEGKNVGIFGNICTGVYYKQAIRYMREHLGNPTLCFFSNDMEWVKNEYKETNAIFIGPEMFEDYHDWYDMYLMSRCRHNIIANSTFSWWAAWLNRNPDKIVIAPKRWMNGCDYEDIYPDSWIKI